MPSGLAPHYHSCLLVCCLTIGHVFWWGASLSAMSSGVVTTICYAFSCGASLSALPVGVVPLYIPCLLAWYLTLGQVCWSIATATDILLVEWRWNTDGVWCYLYSGGIISDMSAVAVPLSDMPACTLQLDQTSILGSFFHICEFVKCCSIRQGIWSVTIQSDMPTGRMLLPRVCKTCRLLSRTPSWIYQILNDAWIAIFGCYNDNVIQESIK